jgi:hypothetical protein
MPWADDPSDSAANRLMRRRVIGLVAIAIVANAIATWAAFNDSNYLCSVMCAVWLGSLALILILLFNGRADRKFCIPALILTTAYSTYIAWSIWSFFTSAD